MTDKPLDPVHALELAISALNQLPNGRNSEYGNTYKLIPHLTKALTHARSAETATSSPLKAPGLKYTVNETPQVGWHNIERLDGSIAAKAKDLTEAWLFASAASETQMDMLARLIVLKDDYRELIEAAKIALRTMQTSDSTALPCELLEAALAKAS